MNPLTPLENRPDSSTCIRYPYPQMQPPFLYCLTLKMKALQPFKTLTATCHSTQHDITKTYKVIITYVLILLGLSELNKVLGYLVNPILRYVKI